MSVHAIMWYILVLFFASESFMLRLYGDGNEKRSLLLADDYITIFATLDGVLMALFDETNHQDL